MDKIAGADFIISEVVKQEAAESEGEEQGREESRWQEQGGDTGGTKRKENRERVERKVLPRKREEKGKEEDKGRRTEEGEEPRPTAPTALPIELVKAGAWGNVLVRADLIQYEPDRRSAAAQDGAAPT